MSARLALVLLLCGCGNRGSLYSEALNPLPLVATRSAVVLVVPQTQRAVVITPGNATPTAVKLGAGARFAAQVPGSELVAILSGTPKAPTLELLDASAGKLEVLALPGFFDAIHFSADGRFGVLVYAQGGVSAVAARNLNEIALLSLGTRAVTRIQLDTESLPPTRVLYGPSQPGRQLVALTLERGVAIFDALHPEVPARRITIRAQGSTFEGRVEEALFAPEARYLFLRVSSLDDVVVVELGAEVGQPVSASINFVAGGTGLVDIEAAPAGYDGAVLALYALSKEALLLDARGISDNNKRLALPTTLTQLQLLQGARVLAWSGALKTVTAWDVSDGRSGTVVLDNPFSGATVVRSQSKGLFAGGQALAVVTVLEETNRLRPRIQAIQLSSTVATSVLDESGGRLFFGLNNSRAVVTMDLQSLQLAEVSFDTTAGRLHHLPQGNWLVMDHGGSLGDVTVIPADSTERARAVHYTDFALTGELDRPGDAP